MGNKKKEPNLSPDEEKVVIYDLLGKGFAQKGISNLFSGKYTQTKISNMKQKKDTYNQGRKDAEDEIKTKIFEKVLENQGKAISMISRIDGDIV